MVVAPDLMTASTIGGQKVHVGSRRVFGRKLHVVGVAARLLDGSRRRRHALIARDVEFLGEVQVRGRDERVDARALGAFERIAGALDVFRPAAGERRNHGPPDARRHLAHTFGVVL